MNRYFAEIAYRGDSFSGWQKQVNAITIQEKIEASFSRIFNTEIPIVGCGRTDAGVHASQYYFHVDLPEFDFKLEDLVFKINGMVGSDIIIKRISEVKSDYHSRFDAIERTYNYHIIFKKDPFRKGMVYEYDQSVIPDLKNLNKAADIVLKYSSFFPFCKSNTDVDTYECQITQSKWEKLESGEMIYSISSNRFLRGMVRLIVGMCINVSIDRLSIADVKHAFEDQVRLERSWSVPAGGLFLSRIKYPYQIH